MERPDPLGAAKRAARSVRKCIDSREFKDVVFEDVVFEDVVFDDSSSVTPC